MFTKRNNSIMFFIETLWKIFLKFRIYLLRVGSCISLLLIIIQALSISLLKKSIKKKKRTQKSADITKRKHTLAPLRLEQRTYTQKYKKIKKEEFMWRISWSRAGRPDRALPCSASTEWRWIPPEGRRGCSLSAGSRSTGAPWRWSGPATSCLLRYPDRSLPDCLCCSDKSSYEMSPVIITIKI